MGIIHDNEIAGVFKYPSKPKFINILCVTVLSLFPLKCFWYYASISLLNSIFHLITQNIRLKFIQVVKSLFLVIFLFFQCQRLSKKCFRLINTSQIPPLFYSPIITISSNLFLCCFLWDNPFHLFFILPELICICQKIWSWTHDPYSYFQIRIDMNPNVSEFVPSKNWLLCYSFPYILFPLLWFRKVYEDALFGI